MDQFTDHGIDHSIRIIENFNKLNEVYEWSNYEKILFTAAALIHDIGMNYRYWCSEEIDPKRICEP